MTRATTFRTTAIIGAFLLALLMIMTVSRAAFSDATSNDDNSVAAGTVVLYNDAPNGTDGPSGSGDGSGDPLFGTAAQAGGGWTVQADNLTPGTAVSNCIEIIYAGSLQATASLDSIAVVPSVAPADFEDEINLTVERFTTACGTAGTGAAVAGGTLGSFVNSETPWDADALSSQFYLITLELDSSVDNAFQGASIDDIDFEWIANQA